MNIEKIWLHLENQKAKGLEFDSTVMISEQAEEVLTALKLDAENTEHPVNTGDLYVTGDYVIVMPQELGFDSQRRLSIIEAVADTFGLFPCPYESPFQLRAAFPDQPEGESILVVTFDIEVEGAPRLFTLESEEGHLWVDATYGDDGIDEPYQLINPDAKLVFQLNSNHPFYGSQGAA